jgi:hypothetical protein
MATTIGVDVAKLIFWSELVQAPMADAGWARLVSSRSDP